MARSGNVATNADIGRAASGTRQRWYVAQESCFHCAQAVRIRVSPHGGSASFSQ